MLITVSQTWNKHSLSHPGFGEAALKVRGLLEQSRAKQSKAQSCHLAQRKAISWLHGQILMSLFMQNFFAVHESFIGLKCGASKTYFLSISYRDLFNEIS